MLGNILAVGLMSMGMGLSGVKDEPQMYAQDDSTYTITYNANDWKQKAPDIKDWLEKNNYVYATKLSISGSITTTEEISVSTIFYSSTNNGIGLNHEGETYYYKEDEKWYYGSAEITVNQVVITSQTYYEANAEPPSMGSDIVGTIASGLGLIGALATEFLAGFGALFYVQGALTPFAIFSLVMLGVAVSFAVVKLVLNLIRSNTGA